MRWQRLDLHRCARGVGRRGGRRWRGRRRWRARRRVRRGRRGRKRRCGFGRHLHVGCRRRFSRSATCGGRCRAGGGGASVRVTGRNGSAMLAAPERNCRERDCHGDETADEHRRKPDARRPAIVGRGGRRRRVRRLRGRGSGERCSRRRGIGTRSVGQDDSRRLGVRGVRRFARLPARHGRSNRRDRRGHRLLGTAMDAIARTGGDLPSATRAGRAPFSAVCRSAHLAFHTVPESRPSCPKTAPG
jgi:hypothetical protein